MQRFLPLINVEILVMRLKPLILVVLLREWFGSSCAISDMHNYYF